MSVDKFGHRRGAVGEVDTRARRKLKRDVDLLQLNVSTLQNQLTEFETKHEEEIKRLAIQLFHWINKIHTTVPPARFHADIGVDENTYIDWTKIFIKPDTQTTQTLEQ